MIYSTEGRQVNTSPLLLLCYFSGCSIQSGNGGAVLYSQSTDFEARSCVFRDCHTWNGQGGGIYATGLKDTVIACCFNGCSASDYGQALLIAGTDGNRMEKTLVSDSPPPYSESKASWGLFTYTSTVTYHNDTNLVSNVREAGGHYGWGPEYITKFIVMSNCVGLTIYSVYNDDKMLGETIHGLMINNTATQIGLIAPWTGIHHIRDMYFVKNTGSLTTRDIIYNVHDPYYVFKECYSDTPITGYHVTTCNCIDSTRELEAPQMSVPSVCLPRSDEFTYTDNSLKLITVLLFVLFVVN